VNIGAPLVAHLEPTKPIQPGQRPLNHPPIAPQPLARRDATPRDPRDDAPRAQRPSAARGVIALVRMQFHWALTWSPTALPRQSQRWDGVERFFEPLGIVDIGSRDSHCQRHTLTVDHNMALRAQLATIRRILARLLAPQEPGHLRYRVRRVSSRSAPHPGVVAGACDASASRRLLAANHASAASMSCHCHSPAPEAASPRECHCSRQTRSPSTRRGR
jgi:hypothetical protein